MKMLDPIPDPSLNRNPETVVKVQWDARDAVPPPSIYGSKRSPISDSYNAKKRHTTPDRGPNPSVPFPHH